MAVEFDGGVVVGADSRTSTGIYVANRVTDKLTMITDRIYVCRSGSAADTQAIAEIVKYYASFYEMENGKPAPVKTVAKMFRDFCYQNKNALMASIIVGGWDEIEGGQVYSIPLGGHMERLPCTIGGSGSTYIYGYMDANYKGKESTKEQALDIVRTAIKLAMNRDGSSGGIIRTAVISKDGVEKTLRVSPYTEDWSPPNAMAIDP